MAIITASVSGGNWNSTGTWVGGVVPTSADSVVLASTSGAVTLNVSATCIGLNCTGYLSTLDLSTNTLTVKGNVVLVTTMTLNGTGTLAIGDATMSITTAGLTIPNLTCALTTTTTTITFNDNVTVGTLLTISTAGNNNIQLVGNTISTPSLTASTGNGQCYGTTSITLNGTGTLSGGLIGNNITVAAGSGTLTISGTVLLGGNFVYSNGNIIASNSTISFTRASLQTTGARTVTMGASNIYNNVSFSNVAANTYSLTTDLYMTGTLTFTTISNNNITLNSSTIYTTSLAIASSGGSIIGTTVIVMNGLGGRGTISSTGTTTVNSNITFDSEINTITFTTGTFVYNTGTMTYNSGIVRQLKTSILSLTAACTLVNIHKCAFANVLITAGQTITMNRFFNGLSNLPARIYSTSTANYTITFQDTIEKISQYIAISNCTLTRPGQLLCISKSSNRGSNVGVRFNNQAPNGMDKGINLTINSQPMGSFLISDPVFSPLI
jgi:hypothetical protein